MSWIKKNPVNVVWASAKTSELIITAARHTPPSQKTVKDAPEEKLFRYGGNHAAHQQKQ